METTEQQKDGLLLLAVSGRLDITTSDVLDVKLQAVMAAGTRRVLLDLEKVDYVSSAGLRVLLATLQRLEAENGALALARTQDYVREVMEVAGLDTVFDMHQTVEEAEAALRKA